MRAPALYAGGTVCEGMELALRFLMWAAGLRRDPTASQIRQRFGVSQATGYRWRNAWLAAHGKYPQPNRGK